MSAVRRCRLNDIVEAFDLFGRPREIVEEGAITPRLACSSAGRLHDNDDTACVVSANEGERPMRAKDLMSREVVTVSPETPVAALARLLADRGISAVPVVEPDGTAAGIVTEADLVRRITGTEERPRGWLSGLFGSAPADAARYAKAHGAKARDVMTVDLVSVDEEATAEEIARLMEERRIKRVLVLHDGRLSGIVSRADLLEAVFAPPETEAIGADDARIRRAVQAALREESWAKPYFLWPTVEKGVVTIHGFCGSPDVHRALRVLAEGIPGVRSAEMKVETPPPSLFGAG